MRTSMTILVCALASLALLATACGSAVRPAELVRADGLLQDREAGANATHGAPALFKTSRELYAKALEAFGDGEMEECIRLAIVATLKFETAREITLKLAADDRLAAASKRIEAAESAGAKDKARLADFNKRIARMEKILALQANESKFKQAQEEERRRLEQERQAAAAQLAAEQARQEQLNREQEVAETVALAAAQIQTAEALEAVKFDAANLDQAKIELERAKLATSQQKFEDAKRFAAESKVKAEAAIATSREAFAKENEQVALLREREALLKDASGLQGLQAKQESRGVVITLTDMFASNKTLVLPEQAYLLDKIAELAVKYPNYPIVVEGYTDSMGRDPDNLALSQGRAQSVLDYLIQQRKLGFDRIKASGYGEANPVADNSSAEGRAKNRRVEVIFLFR